jgi:hypothetical protein
MEQQPEAVPVERAWQRPLIVMPVLGLVALVGGLFESFTLSALLLILAVGGTFVWVGITGRAGRRPLELPLPKGAVWWVLPVLTFAAVELFAFGKHDIVRYPTLSILGDSVLSFYPARVACYFGWLTAFWGLIRR